MGCVGLVIGILVAIILLCQSDTSAKQQAYAEEALFRHIMREATDEQKMITLIYKENHNFAALHTLVVFDIFFN